MEKQILVEPLKKSFTISLKDANRQKRNRSYSNASDCCGVKLCQKKYCSTCDKELKSGDCQRKIVKIGKSEHLIDANALTQVQEQLEQMDELKVHTILDKLPKEAEDRRDSLVYALPSEKKEAQYKELATILKHKIAVGNGVFRNNEFQVLLSVGDDGIIRIWKLVEESQRYDFSPEAIAEKLQKVQLNEEIVALEKQIIDKNTIDGFDVTQFRDSRAEFEERVIEDFVLHGKTPEIKPTINKEAQTNELERLKALMG